MAGYRKYKIGENENVKFYLFVPHFTSPATAVNWTFDNKRKDFSFCCFIWEDILNEIIRTQS